MVAAITLKSDIMNFDRFCGPGIEKGQATNPDCPGNPNIEEAKSKESDESYEPPHS